MSAKWVAVVLVGGMLGVHAATLTVNPPVVTNDFVGKISLAITGVPAGSDVFVERYADANHNGAIDPGEPLMLGFKVRDGAVSTIGGIRNWNVPGDEDGATNGQLNVQLFFPGVDAALGRFEGNYLYRVSSPSGAFAPVTQPFVVRQKSAAQGLRGRITNAATGAPLTNAAVVLLSGGGKGNGLGGTLINSNGYFTLFSAPGNYMLWVVQDGYVGNAGDGQATVNAGQFTTANVSLVAGTNIVTGRLSDATNGTGLPGIVIRAQSSDNHYAMTFTDTNGNFLLKLISGQWNLGYNNSQLPLLGRVSAQSDLQFIVSGNVSNLSLQVPKANALIYGNVTDDQARPLTGIELYGSDQLNQFEADGVSYPADGAYCLGVLAGAWYPQPDADLLAGSGYVGQGTNLTLSAGQAVRADFVLRQVTTHLLGRALDEFGNPVGSLTVGVNGTNGAWLTSQTDGNGNFDLGVTAGTWQFSLESNDAQQRGLVGSTFSVTVADGQTLTNITYLVRHVSAQITGNVSDDRGNPVAQLGVSANATINGANYNTYVQTDNGGNYQLGVCNGSWTVGLDCNGLQNRGYTCPNAPSVSVSGANPTQNFTVSSGSTPLFAVLQSPTLSGGSFGFTVSGTAGRTFDILASPDLRNWSLLYSTNPPGSAFQVSGPIPPGYPHVFFRVQVR